jgi:hypothetical protein
MTTTARPDRFTTLPASGGRLVSRIHIVLIRQVAGF